MVGQKIAGSVHFIKKQHETALIPFLMITFGSKFNHVMLKVVAGIIMDQGKIFLARRAGHKSNPGKWEFPGGKIEPDENPEEALRRELFEEFGVITRTGGYIGSSIHAYKEFKIQLMAYESFWISGQFQLRDHDRFEWILIEDLKNYDLSEADLPIVAKLNDKFF